MRVRLALEGDMDAVLALAEQQVAETLPHLTFDRSIAQASFLEAISNGDLGIVAEASDGEIVGFLHARLYGYTFCSGIFVSQEVIYVRPDKRGTRAAAALLTEYIRWGDIVGAKEVLFGISNGRNPERAAKLFEHLGAERVGYHHRIVRDG